jgi:hypothetical protein
MPYISSAKLPPTEKISSMIDETFELAKEYVYNNVGIIEPLGRLACIEVVNPDDPEGTWIYISSNTKASCISRPRHDQFTVEELFIVSEGLYSGLDERYEYSEVEIYADPGIGQKTQTGHSLTKFKNGAAIKQHFQVPGAYNGEIYYGSERRMRYMEETGNIYFHKGADNKYKIRTLNILCAIQNRIKGDF